MKLSQDTTLLKKTIEKALQDLPALPAVVTKVLQETEHPDASAQSVERLIASDQALAMKVLKVVNSAYYGLSGQVTSLGQAVVILGLQQVRNLVLSVGAVNLFPVQGPHGHERLKQFWLHSFGSAATAQMIGKAKGLNYRDVESLFLGGLLHDIGKLFLFANFTEIYDALMEHAETHGISIEEAEIEYLGLTHSQVGEEMAKAWKLPTILSDFIGSHEGPFSAESDPMLMCVHVADFLTKGIYFAVPTNTRIEVDPVALEWLSLTEDDFQHLREAAEEKVGEALALFGLMSVAA
jgi:putative nucleotidyltransferase with HDIG domain